MAGDQTPPATATTGCVPDILYADVQNYKAMIKGEPVAHVCELGLNLFVVVASYLCAACFGIEQLQ